jgi:ribulose-bisphosphate carboxylase small chain
MYEIESARKANPKAYIRVVCYINARGVESCVLSFIINRPDTEYMFCLNRTELKGRQLVYTLIWVELLVKALAVSSFLSKGK